VKKEVFPQVSPINLSASSDLHQLAQQADFLLAQDIYLNKPYYSSSSAADSQNSVTEI